MGDGIVERLTELEGAVKRAAESLAHLREENAQLKREVKRLGDERRLQRRWGTRGNAA